MRLCIYYSYLRDYKMAQSLTNPFNAWLSSYVLGGSITCCMAMAIGMFITNVIRQLQVAN